MEGWLEGSKVGRGISFWDDLFSSAMFSFRAYVSFSPRISGA